MSVRGMWAVPVVFLAGCSLFGGQQPSSPDGLEQLDTEHEVIHTVGAEPAPVEAQESPREVTPPPAGNSPRSFEDQTRTVGYDPRRAAAASQAASASVASTPSLVRPEPDQPMAPMAGRVGIMSLLGNELRHVHASLIGGHEQSYNVQYDFNGYVMEELRKALLTRTPYQPVSVASTGALRQAANTWQDSWDGTQFAPTFQREFDGIIKQNRLSMLIIVAYARSGDGQLIGGRTLSGSGLYTRGQKAAVFSTLQFYRLVGEPAKLVLPIAPRDERSIGDLPDANLPKDLDNLPARYLVPVYAPLRTLVQNKIHGLVSLPRKLGY